MEDRFGHVNQIFQSLFSVILNALLCTVLCHALSLRAQENHYALGLQKFSHGDYDEAKNLFQLTIDEASPLAPKAVVGLIDYYFRLGKYQKVAQYLELGKKFKSIEREILYRQAKFYFLKGDYSDADLIYQKILKASPQNLRAMKNRAIILEILGYTEKARAIWLKITEYFLSLSKPQWEDWIELGYAFWHLERYQEANDALIQAIEENHEAIQAYLALGELYLEKYNPRDAEVMFQKALDIDPNHPKAHLGMARVYFESNFDLHKSTEALESALSINPNDLESRDFKVILLLSDANISKALREIQRTLFLNPKHLPTLALKATAYYLADEREKFKAVEREILDFNPNYSELYLVMAYYGEIVHRYEESIQLYQKALEINPKEWRAYAGLGLAYSRIGRDEESYQYLQRAFERDPYNLRAYNLLELYRKTLRQYDILNIHGIQLRMHREERALLEYYIPDAVEQAMNYYRRRYQFEPLEPLWIEVFKDPQSFAVKSVGLPNISPTGICFGRVMSIQSPSHGNFNWTQVIWHEMAHVFHIQISDSRVPRWFTEGLAEYETSKVQKTWRREYDIELYLELQTHKPMGIELLNKKFTHAEDHRQLITAYYEATKVIEYIEQTYGYEILVQMLRAWGKHASTEEIFNTLLKTSIKQFDRDFERWLYKELSWLKGSYEIDVHKGLRDLQKWHDRAKRRPYDAKILSWVGFGELERQNIKEARQFFQRAYAIAPQEILVLMLGASIALEEGNYEQALLYFRELMKKKKIDGYTLELRLGFLYQKLGDLEASIKHYQRAKHFYFQGKEPYLALGEIYFSLGKEKEALSEWKQASAIDQDNFELANKVMILSLDMGDLKTAITFAKMAIEIRPFDPKIHSIYGKMALKLKDWQSAEREFQAHLVLNVSEPFEGYIGLAEVYFQTHRMGKAKMYLEMAQNIRPKDSRILEMKKKFGSLFK